MFFTANTSDELVNALNEEDVISGALIEQSDLFISILTDDIWFLYGSEDVFAVHSENYPHSSVSVIRQVLDYEAPYIYEDSMTWDSEMLEVSEADVSRARGLLDDVSSADYYSRWSDTLEFLQHVYSSAAYWVAAHIPEASGTAERVLSECLQRNDFDFADDLSIDDDIVVSHYGEVFTLSDGVVYRGHRFPYTGDYDDCVW
jgi:hypothetical protein